MSPALAKQSTRCHTSQKRGEHGATSEASLPEDPSLPGPDLRPGHRLRASPDRVRHSLPQPCVTAPVTPPLSQMGKLRLKHFSSPALVEERFRSQNRDFSWTHTDTSTLPYSVSPDAFVRPFSFHSPNECATAGAGDAVHGEQGRRAPAFTALRLHWDRQGIRRGAGADGKQQLRLPWGRRGTKSVSAQVSIVRSRTGGRSSPLRAECQGPGSAPPPTSLSRGAGGSPPP